MTPRWIPRWGRTVAPPDPSGATAGNGVSAGTGMTTGDSAPAGNSATTGNGEPARVVVLSRVGCHLCVEALAVVEAVCARHGVAYDLVEVDDDPALRARYGDLVPVVLVDGDQVATWRLSADDLEAALTRPGKGGR